MGEVKVKHVREAYVKSLAVYSVSLGLLYLLVGILEFGKWAATVASSIGELSWYIWALNGSPLGAIWLPSDAIGGFAMAVIGSVYLGGFHIWRLKYDSLGFPIVGFMLSALYGVLYLLILISRSLGNIIPYIEFTSEYLSLNFLIRLLTGNQFEELYAAVSGLLIENIAWQWTWTASMLRPEIWLFIVALPLGALAWRTFKSIQAAPQIVKYGRPSRSQQ
nr:hypothetical protein [Candidatus Freyrarchaeum guaymaensis]